MNVVQNYEKYIFRKEALQNLNLLNGESKIIFVLLISSQYDRLKLNELGIQIVSDLSKPRQKETSIHQTVSLN